MGNEEIQDKVIKILSEVLCIKKNKINLDSHLIDDLCADSFNAVEILYAIEQEFKIKIPPSKLAKAMRVSDIINYVSGNQ